MVSPSGVAVDGKGRLFVVDTFLGKVYVYDPGKKRFMEIPVGKERLSSPVDVALDAEHSRLFVSDSKGGIGRPTGLAVNPITGELLVVDTYNKRVQIFQYLKREVKGTR